jgi:quercetin dioxygenase-like cupin family protein
MDYGRSEGAEGRVVHAVEGLPVRGRITMRVLVEGDEILLLEARYEAGAGTELHRHEHESICYVLSGRVRTSIGGNSREMGPGEFCRQPTAVDHSMEAIEESVVLEMKSPAPELGKFLR